MANDPLNGGSKNDFWDISALVPRRKSAYQRSATPDVGAVEITDPPRGGEGKPDEKTFYVSRTHAQEVKAEPVPERTYQPAHALLLAVRLYGAREVPAYHERFCRQARELHPFAGKPCEPVSFFSYVPQYGQMSRAQLDYYLWWRTCFREGRAIAADFSYILLYVYEIINLGDLIAPTEGAALLLRLWLAYRDKHPSLDTLLREWLCDYALLYELPTPRLPRDKLRDMIKGARLREFYVGGAEGEGMRDAMLYFCSNYDYKKSKFYREDTAAHFDLILPGAVSVALSHLMGKNGEIASRQGGYSTVSRELFAGAPVSGHLKKRAEVDFLSFSHTYGLRYVVSDVLKYAENALRAALGIKSRLSVYEVPLTLRAPLDAYLAGVLPKKAAKKRGGEQMPDYEVRYILPVTPISPTRAQEIEAASWETTRRLVEAFEDVPMAEDTTEKRIPSAPVFEKITPSAPVLEASTPPVPPMPPICETPASAAAPAQASAWREALGVLVDFLPLARGGSRAAQRAFAAEQGMMLDLIADKINTVAGDILGDILLEEVNGCYTLIEDYIPYLMEEGVLQ